MLFLYLNLYLSCNYSKCDTANALCEVMVSKQDWKTFTSELDSHWLPYTSSLVPQLSKT